MRKWIVCIALGVILLALVACREETPNAEWELAVDGDIETPRTYTFQDLLRLRRTKLTNILTQDSTNPGELTSWEGVALLLLLRTPEGAADMIAAKPGTVEYSLDWWANITLANGTTRRVNMSDLRGSLIALKDGDGNWLADTGGAPIQLIAPNRPSSEWLEGPVRITIDGP